MLAGRSIEDKGRWRQFRGFSDRFEYLVALSIKVQIDMADLPYVCFDPAVRPVLDRIHSHEHYVEL